MTMNNQDNPSMEDIITLAQSNTQEGWEKIDSVLPQISQEDHFVSRLCIK